MINVGINGFGRIGRTFYRLASNNSNINVVAINDIADVKTIAHLLKYDSVYDFQKPEISISENLITYNGRKTHIFSEKSPENIPWGKLDVDIVIEATGIFLKKELMEMHLKAGAKKVILSAPASDDTKTVVLGINEQILNASDTIISNASCTTNNAAPMLKIIDEALGLEHAYITTVHAYTGDQRLMDAPHKDLRRARAAAVSIIPTTTGAAKAITKVMPHLHGKIGGSGVRVPVINGSLTDITCIVKNQTNTEQLNNYFKNAAESSLKGILAYTEDPIVSVDIIGNPNSCIVDAGLTSVLGNMIKVVGWYDNEFGYSNRLVELTRKFADIH